MASKSSLLRRWPKRVFNHISDSARQIFSRAGVIERTIWEDVGPLSIVILISLSTENAFDLGVKHAEETRNVTSPARPLDGNRDNILSKKLIKRNINLIPTETDKGTLQDVIWVRKSKMEELGLENVIAHQDKLPIMRHRRIQPRHRVMSFLHRRKLIDIDNCRHLNAPIRKQLESGTTPFPESRSAAVVAVNHIIEHGPIRELVKQFAGAGDLGEHRKKAHLATY